MSPFTHNTRVKDIACASEDAIALFERFSIDYSVQGDESLRQACSRAGVSANEVLRIVDAMGSSRVRREVSLDLTDLVEEACGGHRALGARVKSLSRLLDETEPHLPPTARVAWDRFVTSFMARSRHAEERVFPLVRALWSARTGTGSWPGVPVGTLRERLTTLRKESVRVAEPLSELTNIVHEVVRSFDPDSTSEEAQALALLRDALGELRLVVQRHLHLENNVLIPRAHALEPDRRRTPR